MGDVFIDAILDTLKVLPFLLAMNFLIEFAEYKTQGLKADKILKGGLSPLLGTAAGIVPQCGFSVVATELYSKRKIALGTLLAVYLATSDEAIPIMLSSYEGVVKLLPVLIIKICFSLVVGYSAFAVQKLIERKTEKQTPAPESEEEREHEHTLGDEHGHDEHTLGDEHDEHTHEEHAHIFGCHHHSLREEENGEAVITKRQKAARFWRVYLKHPIVHTLTVTAFIFAVNAVFGIAVYYVGEDSIASFIGSTGYLQPVLAGLVGLIPNCASSVVITELYVIGGLNLGGAVAGLCVGAGLGYAVLVKQNRPVKNTALIIALAYGLSVSLGLCITALGF